MQFTQRALSRPIMLAASLAIFSISLSVATVAQAFEDETPAAYFAHDQQRVTSDTAPSPKPVPGKTVSNSNLKAMVTASAQRHRVPVALAHSIVRIESGYNCRARSHAGAIGLMQTLTATARGVGVSGPLTDCATSLEAGMRYLRMALDAHGAGCAGASAYQRGIRANGVCTAYGRKVLAMAAQG